MNVTGPWPYYHQHAEETHANRRPASPAHPFAQYRAGERSDEKGGRKRERKRLIELQVTQRHKIAQGRGKQQNGPSHLQSESACDKKLRTRPWIGQHERKYERPGVARLYDFERVHVQIEKLGGGVKHGKACDGTAHQGDAGQALCVRLRHLVCHSGG